MPKSLKTRYPFLLTNVWMIFVSFKLVWYLLICMHSSSKSFYLVEAMISLELTLSSVEQIHQKLIKENRNERPIRCDL